MTVSELTANPFLQSVSEKLQRFATYVVKVPLTFWRSGLIFLALIWVCHSLATLFWVVLSAPELPQPSKLAVAPVAQSASTGSINLDVAALQSQNLFGVLGDVREDVDVRPVGDGIDSQEKTTLNLKLHGVVASTNVEHARAIIDDNKEQLLLRINEELPRNKGVKLARVMEDKVILDNNGNYENLFLYSEDDFAGSKASGSRRPNKVKVPNRKTLQNQAKLKSTSNNLAKQTTVKKEQMPKSIGDVVRFSVHRENGAMVGYRVRPGRDRELFEQVGLKANDVVTTVNGIRMDDPKQLKAVYQSLKTATSADLGVLRNGEELSIQISVEGG